MCVRVRTSIMMAGCLNPSHFMLSRVYNAFGHFVRMRARENVHTHTQYIYKNWKKKLLENAPSMSPGVRKRKLSLRAIILSYIYTAAHSDTELSSSEISVEECAHTRILCRRHSHFQYYSWHGDVIIYYYMCVRCI